MAMTKKRFMESLNITHEQFIGEEVIGSSLDLSRFKSIPKGFNPTVGGSLCLRNLTTIPNGFNPTVSGSLYLYNLTTIPKGFNPTVGGILYLDNLTTIPDGFNPTVGGSLYLYNLTTIPKGFNPTVGGILYLDNLTTIPEGFNPTVGGRLIVDERLPKRYTKLPENHIFSWQDEKYILADGIFGEVVSKRGNIHKLKKVGKEEFFFLVSNEHFNAHGETLKQAFESLAFKSSKREEIESYKSLSLDSVLKTDEAVKMYRTITGACEYGTKEFLKSQTIKESYSVAEIVDITDGQYGNGKLKEFLGVA